jgi:hypothetical protein
MPETVYGVPVQDRRPGYEFDPYDAPDEHAEIFKVGDRVIWDGLWSTYREIHISMKAIFAGLKASTLQNVPDCPPLWQDEGQYWLLAMVANVAKIAIYTIILMKIADGTIPAGASNLLSMIGGIA